MPVDPQVIDELRTMFLAGALPSRLVRHVAARHDGDPRWPDLVEPYFAEAFGVVTFALAGRPADVDIDRLDLTPLDTDTLCEMVGRSGRWRGAYTHRPAWFDGLAVSPDELRIAESVRPETDPAFAGCWDAMSPRAKDAVRRAMGNAQAYQERSQVLARLAARLQERVAEWERASEPVGA